MTYLVQLTGSRFFKSAHYLVLDRGFLVVQRSKARATRFTTREAAEAAAAKINAGYNPNGFTAAVINA
jgi:hypothetical protein